MSAEQVLEREQWQIENTASRMRRRAQGQEVLAQLQAPKPTHTATPGNGNGAAPTPPEAPMDGEYAAHLERLGLTPDDVKLETCRGNDCSQQVFYAYMLKKDGQMGKPTPINWPPPQLGEGGHLKLVVDEDFTPVRHTDGRGRTLAVVQQTTKGQREAGQGQFTGHFGTCPNASDFRRR
jgi:hypothetical protein